MRALVLASLLLALAAAVPSARAAPAGPQECLDSLTTDAVFCSEAYVVRDLDGRGYGAKVDNVQKTRVCLVPSTSGGCYDWSPWLPTCFTVTLIVAGNPTPVTTPCP